MFAINHAAAALLLKRRYPELALAPLLLSVQVMELLVANLSLSFAEIPGPEHAFAGRPLLMTAVIFAQIVVTLLLVGWAAKRRANAVVTAPGGKG